MTPEHSPAILNDSCGNLTCIGTKEPACLASGTYLGNESGTKSEASMDCYNSGSACCSGHGEPTAPQGAQGCLPACTIPPSPGECSPNGGDPAICIIDNDACWGDACVIIGCVCH